ncbi:MAG: hypothetical protein L0G99_11410 [Propionibacteriales bacterium]|nr:hypothetical protein [Propionibacteriales bacterium]
MNPRVRLLGPQRDPVGARTAVAELIPDGPIATINAGWREREDEITELNDVLGGRMHNLEVYRRWREMRSADPAFDAAEVRLRHVLGEAQAVYQLRLRPALDTITALGRRDEVARVQQAALDDANRVVQELDAWQLRVVGAARQEFYDRTDLGVRAEVVRHRHEVAAMINNCAGFVISGGHVGVLLHCLHVFNLRPLLRGPVITWSAGAMALSERVVLFADRSAQGGTPAQVYAEGLGVHTGLVCFPHADHRLSSDPTQLARLARRFAPARCVLLDAGTSIDIPAGAAAAELPPNVRVLDPDSGVDHG